MKILQKGYLDHWEIERVCTAYGGCGARLLVDEEDIYIKYGPDYMGADDYLYTFRCPWCGTENNIPNNDMIDRARKIALKKYNSRLL